MQRWHWHLYLFFHVCPRLPSRPSGSLAKASLARRRVPQPASEGNVPGDVPGYVRHSGRLRLAPLKPSGYFAVAEVPFQAVGCWLFGLQHKASLSEACNVPGTLVGCQGVSPWQRCRFWVSPWAATKPWAVGFLAFSIRHSQPVRGLPRLFLGATFRATLGTLVGCGLPRLNFEFLFIKIGVGGTRAEPLQLYIYIYISVFRVVVVVFVMRFFKPGKGSNAPFPSQLPLSTGDRT